MIRGTLHILGCISWLHVIQDIAPTIKFYDFGITNNASTWYIDTYTDYAILSARSRMFNVT